MRDNISGLSGDDIIDGAVGDDEISGDTGNDTIYGGAGHDRIVGGTENDIIYGGIGRDPLWGCSGADVFAYASVTDSPVSARESIKDFDFADVIYLSAIDAVAGGADNAFNFIGAGISRAPLDNCTMWPRASAVGGSRATSTAMLWPILPSMLWGVHNP